MNEPLSKIRHDLRTPVNHILGFAGLLEEELADRGIGGLDDLQKIQNAARELVTLIDSRLGDGTVPNPAPVSKPVDTPRAIPSGPRARVLVVDDDAGNRELAARYVERLGHSAAQAPDGRSALETLRSGPFDAVLLDLLMPVLDGFSTLREIKDDPNLRDVPVIMISALDELGSVARCIEAGAEDYLPKPFDATLLRARLTACLEKKALRDAEHKHLRTIEETQKRLSEELAEAARYVRSILPPPSDAPLPIDWAYVPSTELGGDAFGYHWLDDDTLALYLLDVCGHGVGASLLSVSAINLIRAGALPGTDFTNPSSVLSALNVAFPMESQNNMYFTIWYGVFRRSTSILRHASAGHPAALLLEPGASEAREILSPGLIIGVLPEAEYRSEEVRIAPGSTLILLCDGTYEIRDRNGTMLEFDSFRDYVSQHGNDSDFFENHLAWIRSLRGTDALDDDYSMLRVRIQRS
ncbi:MAG: SpoIIE family protein phosphatase [Terrimicrobiaceae bacterium]|nr:SpoIIE family protein phosphatase [Terrimicrobiaceae bacterium]